MSTSNEIQDYELLLSKLRKKEAWKSVSGSEEIPWSKKIIEKLTDQLDWPTLCDNSCIEWDEEMIDSFKDRIDWYVLSQKIYADRRGCGSKEKDWTLLKKYESNWNWDVLSRNSESIPLHILKQFADKWNWRELIDNRYIEWSFEFYESLKQYIPTQDFDYLKNSELWGKLVEMEEQIIIGKILEK